MIIDEAHEPEIEEENYFISMTDMMVGLVFIFVILLMYYALQFRQVTDNLTSADQTRTEILQKLEKSLQEKGVPVTIDTQNGVLRLPDAILFDSARERLKPEGIEAVQKLAFALKEVLPCFTNGLPITVLNACHNDEHKIESLYIEGHTDSDPLTGGGALSDNWDLSVLRATNTYREITRTTPELSALCVAKGGKCEPILSVSGYGPQRPVDTGVTPEAKKANRRIDLRIIMVTPEQGDVDKISGRVSQSK